EIFHHALDALGVRTNEALMVGNSLLEDIAGAQKLGIAAAWLRSAPDAEGVVPDYVLESVSDLLTIPELEGPDA
ncbi:MAG: HAD family hydrolase, partial [Dehalococcoidia bacterium]